LAGAIIVLMQFHKHLLSNGLRVITVPMPALASVTVTVWVKTGSRNEDAKTSGISHFLEHMTFKGSPKRPSAKDISEAVDAIGGEMNAGTSKEWTDFYIKTRAQNLDIAMDVLSDMVINPLIDAKEIEREKGVIVEEIAMYEDTPMMHIGDVFEQLIFKGNPLGWDTTGSAKTVKSITRADFIEYRKMHYFTDNLLLTVSGGITEKEAIKLAEKYFSQITPTSPRLRGASRFQSDQKHPEVLLYSQKKEQAHLIIGFRGNARNYKYRYAEAVLSAILGAGMSSRMFIEVRERRGLAYSVRTSVDRYMDTGYLATYAGVDPGKATEAIKVIMEQYLGISSGQFPVSSVELKKAKEIIKGHIALALEDTRAINDFYGEDELFGTGNESPEEVFAKVDKVTIEEVVAEAKKLFKPEKLNLAIIGPFKDKEKFVKLLQ
jgi:predicted Zn-dependent peptidase